MTDKFVLLSKSADIDDCDRVITVGESVLLKGLEYELMSIGDNAITIEMFEGGEHPGIVVHTITPDLINCFTIPERYYCKPWRLRVTEPEPEQEQDSNFHPHYIDVQGHDTVTYNGQSWHPWYAWVQDGQEIVALKPDSWNKATDWLVIPLRDLAVDNNVVLTLEEDTRLWSVAIYLTDRAYGGPEEGGWWYDCGTRVNDAELYREMEMEPRIFYNRQFALKYREQLDSAVQKFNDGRRHPSSVCSDGHFHAFMYEGWAPAHFPERKPHYE